MSNMLSLVDEDGVTEFLGPMTQSILKLREYGYTASQAREAVLRAFANGGDAVDLDNISRMANFIQSRGNEHTKRNNWS